MYIILLMFMLAAMPYTRFFALVWLFLGSIIVRKSYTIYIRSIASIYFVLPLCKKILPCAIPPSIVTIMKSLKNIYQTKKKTDSSNFLLINIPATITTITNYTFCRCICRLYKIFTSSFVRCLFLCSSKQ